MGRTLTPRIAGIGVVLALGVLACAFGLYALTRPAEPSPTPTQAAIASPSTPASPQASGSAAPSSTPSSSPSPSAPPRERALAAREVFGFLPYWKLGNADTQVPLDVLTTVAIFGVEAARDGGLVRETGTGAEPPGWGAWNGPETAALIADAHERDVRVVLTIQRFAWTAAQARRTVALLSDEGRRQHLAQEIVAEIEAKGADGVNLDFEPVPLEVRPQFVDLVRELRAVLDQSRPGLQLTFDVTTDVLSYDLAALTADDAADAALLMGYDFRVATASLAGSVDPLLSLTSNSLTPTLEAALSVAHPDHVILALPWYGRAWSTASDAPGSATLRQRRFGNSVAVEYADAITQALQFGRNWDAVEASAWTVYRKRGCDTCPETWRQLWYDDVDAMRAKQQLVLDEGLRGLGIWALGDDRALPDAWAAIRLTLGGVTDAVAPESTANVDPAAIERRHGDLPVVDGDLVLETRAIDDPGGSGVAFTRIATSDLTAADGGLTSGITFPASAGLRVSLADPRLGPLPGRGARSVFVQARDVAGNWSPPEAVSFWLPAAVSALPSPIP